MINIKTDSRNVVKGDVFVALKGYTVDGHDYIQKAIQNGATKIVCEKGNYSVETLVVNDTKTWLEHYLRDNYSNAFENMHIIGVTGTNGKTTTCYLTYNALLALGEKVAYIGTIGLYVNGKKIKDLPNTTPEILEVYNILLDCKDNGVNYVVMEVSSHSLILNRLCGIYFDAGIFTNLTIDHLDFHNTLEEYALAKSLLFKKLKNRKIALINNDAEYKEKMINSENVNITYGFNNSDYTILSYNTEQDHTDFIFKYKNNTYYVNSLLLGKHNVYNLMSLIAVTHEMGFDMDRIISTVKCLAAPLGRMEKINYKNNTIIVDYAHTPDAVVNIINTSKEFTKGKIYTLIGCGGNRDKSKRPIMGNISTKESDYVIFTSDNPRHEKEEDILNDITNNLNCDNYIKITDRVKAIEHGINMLNTNDTLLVLGKGHEDYQIIGNNKINMSDVEIIKKYIKRK